MTDQRWEQDRHRPRYHFLPPANWMNDPNGLIHYKGWYHLFYQYNPNGAFWGTMHWGHAMSEDLVHWRHMPVALAPEPGTPDEDGCYSGATVVHDGVPIIVYTGVRRPDQLACLARSTDDYLSSWTKHPSNPVISGTPAGVPTTIFRDHTLWREDGSWMMGVGAGIEGEGGAVLLYRSDDLVDWEYLHPLVVEDPALNASGQILSTGWECPDFFFLEDAPVLIACNWDGDPLSVSYWTGEYADGRFTPCRKGVVDAGSPFYAPQSFSDASGRRIMFGWIRESRSVAEQRAAGWSGVMSLPRVVTIREDGVPRFRPAPEVDVLRGRRVQVTPVAGWLDIDGIPGNSMELQVQLSPDTGGAGGLKVGCSRDGREETIVHWSAVEGLLSLDTRRSSLDDDAIGELASLKLDLPAGEPLSLRLFVDRSVIEVYANDRACISGRIYPMRDEHCGVCLLNPAAVSSPITVYEMLPAHEGI